MTLLSMVCINILPYHSSPWHAFSETVRALTIAILTKTILHICIDSWVLCMIHWNVKYKFYSSLYVKYITQGHYLKTSSAMEYKIWNTLTQAQSEVPHPNAPYLSGSKLQITASIGMIFSLLFLWSGHKGTLLSWWFFNNILPRMKFIWFISYVIFKDIQIHRCVIRAQPWPRRVRVVRAQPWPNKREWDRYY